MVTKIRCFGCTVLNTSSVYYTECSPPQVESPSVTTSPLGPSSASPSSSRTPSSCSPPRLCGRWGVQGMGVAARRARKRGSQAWGGGGSNSCEKRCLFSQTKPALPTGCPECTCGQIFCRERGEHSLSCEVLSPGDPQACGHAARAAEPRIGSNCMRRAASEPDSWFQEHVCAACPGEVTSPESVWTEETLPGGSASRSGWSGGVWAWPQPAPWPGADGGAPRPSHQGLGSGDEGIPWTLWGASFPTERHCSLFEAPVPRGTGAFRDARGGGGRPSPGGARAGAAGAAGAGAPSGEVASLAPESGGFQGKTLARPASLVVWEEARCEGRLRKGRGGDAPEGPPSVTSHFLGPRGHLAASVCSALGSRRLVPADSRSERTLQPAAPPGLG